MPCYHPNTAYRGAGGAIVFDKHKSLTRIPFPLPCGRCIGCRMENAKQWGVRCLHEKKMWPSSCFVTLTYSDEFLPPGGSLSLRDCQLFMKRLRFHKKSTKTNPIRFFMGGEYGEINRRPHYHALLFNCDFADRVHFSQNSRGEVLSTSDELSSLWSVDGKCMGHCTVGEVTFDSAVYVAKYMLKKLNVSERSSAEAVEAYNARYVVYDENGEVFERRREFAVMSRRPGIGAAYYAKYGKEVRDWDNVIVEERPCPPPAYYDSQTEKFVGPQHREDDILCKCLLCVTKRGRKRRAVSNRAENTGERLAVKEKIALIEAGKKERKL